LALGKEPEGKISLGRPGHRWEDNRKISMFYGEVM
jgi:hypothetical protein